MKTSRKQINDELKEIPSEFLHSVSPGQVEIPRGLNNHLQSRVMDALDTDVEDVVEKEPINWRIPAYGIAAMLVIGLFIFSLFTFTNRPTIVTWNDISSAEIVEWVENDLDEFSDADILGLLEEKEVTIFESTTISEQELEDYFIENYINDLTQEELL